MDRVEFWECDMVPASNVQYTFAEEAEDDEMAKHDAEIRRRNRLCKDLLNVIKDSVLTFKPSKSLDCLKMLEDAADSTPAVEIDVVVSGGGLKGYFITGCSHILKHELKKQNIKIARVSGASAGAWCGLFMLTDFSTENWLETYYLCKERQEMTMHEAYDDIWPWISKVLPENAWQICSGRLYISITEVTLFGFRNRIISEFSSNRDLFEACLASSTVPYISLPHLLRRYRDMWCLDGGITNNTPIFTDSSKRRQLVFRLGDVFYPVKLLINPHDLCIESLVVRGAILMSRFLQGEPSDAFAWLNPAGSTTLTFNASDSNSRKGAKELIAKQSINSYLFAFLSWESVIAVSVIAGVAGAYVYRHRSSNLDMREYFNSRLFSAWKA